MGEDDDRQHRNEPTDATPCGQDDSLREIFDAFIAQFESAKIRAAVARGFRATPEEMGAAAVAAAAEALRSTGEASAAKPRRNSESGH